MTAEEAPTSVPTDTTHISLVPAPETWAKVQINDQEPTTRPVTPAIAVAVVDSALSGPPDSLRVEPPPPVVAVTISEADQITLQNEAHRNLAEASQLLSNFDSTGLIRSDKEKLRTVYGFIAQAETAIRQKDYPSAAGLARKARLLAVELTSQ